MMMMESSTVAATVDENGFSSSIVILDHPEIHDVLSGKGRSFQEHFGNQEMNKLIDEQVNESVLRIRMGRHRLHGILLMRYRRGRVVDSWNGLNIGDGRLSMILWRYEIKLHMPSVSGIVPERRRQTL